MLEAEFEEQTEDAVDAAETEPACVDLVPVALSAQWSEHASQQLTRPDPCFLTQLIATAEQAPQTRQLRRATPADAQAAYQSVTGHNHIMPTGVRTAQSS